MDVGLWRVAPRALGLGVGVCFGSLLLGARGLRACCFLFLYGGSSHVWSDNSRTGRFFGPGPGTRRSIDTRFQLYFRCSAEC